MRLEAKVPSRRIDKPTYLSDCRRAKWNAKSRKAYKVAEVTLF